ncbi:hypothetical protein ABFS83_04G131100 [Erythranthe nasuta]
MFNGPVRGLAPKCCVVVNTATWWSGVPTLAAKLFNGRFWWSGVPTLAAKLFNGRFWGCPQMLPAVAGGGCIIPPSGEHLTRNKCWLDRAAVSYWTGGCLLCNLLPAGGVLLIIFNRTSTFWG